MIELYSIAENIVFAEKCACELTVKPKVEFFFVNFSESYESEIFHEIIAIIGDEATQRLTVSRRTRREMAHSVQKGKLSVAGIVRKWDAFEKE